MGMFDTIMVPCPKCGERSEFQTKSGHCVLDCWNLEDAPEEPMWNVNRHAPVECEECGTMFEVRDGKSVFV